MVGDRFVKLLANENREIIRISFIDVCHGTFSTNPSTDRVHNNGFTEDLF